MAKGTEWVSVRLLTIENFEETHTMIINRTFALTAMALATISLSACKEKATSQTETKNQLRCPMAPTSKAHLNLTLKSMRTATAQAPWKQKPQLILKA